MKNKILKLVIICTILLTILCTLAGCGEQIENEEKNENKITNSNEANIQEEQQENELTISKGGSFAEYQGYTYYWKLTKESRSQTALYANYEDKVNYKNDLIKMDKNGKEQIILTDKGSGDILIVNDKIFLTYPTEEYGISQIYSIDLNGKNKIEYAQGNMKYIIGDFIICQTKADGNIFRINTKTDKTETIKQKANVIGCSSDGIIYYTENYDYKVGTLKIGSLNDNKDNGIIATFATTDFKEYTDTPPIEIVEFWEENEKINMYIGYRLGTAHLLQELFHLKMNKDGNNIQKEDITSYEIMGDEDKLKKEGVYINTVQENSQYTNNLVYIDKQTQKVKQIMSQKEINDKFNFKKDDEHTTTLYKSSIIADNIYIVLDYGEHYPEEDIGWRYSYKRIKTVCFKYNIKSKKVETIYEF